MLHEEGLACLRTCIFFPKHQPKDTTFLFKPCFACVPATLLHMFAYFIYAARSNSQGEPKIPSFPATSVNLPTVLHGCSLDGINIMSASKSITTKNHRITERSLCWGEKGRRGTGGSSPAASPVAAQRLAAGCTGSTWVPAGRSKAELGCTLPCGKLILQRPWQYWHSLLLL